MFTIQPTHFFNRCKGKLKKKYPHVEDDYAPLIKKLKDGDFDGDKISGVGHAVYKVRVASIDQKKGKSGGFRIIYYVITSDNIIYLLVIYAKAKQENISAKEIQALLDTIP